MKRNLRKPDFLVIGAQKSGTTWLWNMLDQHPETDLPKVKEIHYFGSSELYSKGADWYYKNFEDTDPQLITGEASTTYFFDRVPFWYNDTNNLEYDSALPPLPELVAKELPKSKIIILLRDPVRRAVSAYLHWMKQGELSPSVGLKRTVSNHPRLRIVEYGDYVRHLVAWYDAFPKNQILVLNFEDDVVRDPGSGLRKTFEFLGLDKAFQPSQKEKSIHKSWTWTRIVASYYAGPFRHWIKFGRLGNILDRHDILKKRAVRSSDIEYLRAIYLPSQETLEKLIGRKLEQWDYGRSSH